MSEKRYLNKLTGVVPSINQSSFIYIAHFIQRVQPNVLHRLG